MRICTIAFDFGNVIYSWDKSIFDYKLVDNSSCSREEIRTAFIDSGLEKEYNKGEKNIREVYQIMKRRCDLEVSKKEFIEAYSNIFSRNEEVIELIGELSREYKLLLFSDTCKAHYELVIKKSPVYDFFDEEVVSFKIGALKNSKRGYKSLIRKSNSSPSEIVFIDDKEKYIEIAESVGINGIVFENIDQLKRDLEGLGVVL